MSNLSKAQLYKSALGIRLGPTNGITYKSFIKKAPVFRVVISLTALLYPFKLSINDMNECTDYSLMGQRVVL